MADISKLLIKSSYYSYLTTVEESPGENYLYTGEGHSYNAPLNFYKLISPVATVQGLLLRAGGGTSRTAPIVHIQSGSNTLFKINSLGNPVLSNTVTLPNIPTNTSSSVCFTGNSLWFYGEL
jgi:hypothetical protein